MKASFPAAVILHNEFRSVPSAVEIEVPPALRIDLKIVSGIQQPNAHLVAVGVQVSAIDVAAEVQALRYPLRRTQPTRAAQSAGGPLPVQSQMRHASEVGIKIDEQRVRVTGFGSQHSESPPRRRSPPPADMIGPGSQNSGQKKEKDRGEHEDAETTQSSPWSKCHGEL